MATTPTGFTYAAGAGWLSYAHWDDSFYVAASPSSLDVIAANNTTITHVIPVGDGPYGVAVDTAANFVFVSNSLSNNVTVVNGTSQTVIGSLAVQSDPEGIAFDASNQTLYVADNGSDNVTVIDVPSMHVVANISVGLEPAGVAWDSQTNRIFVTDHGSNEVSVISPVTNAVIATIAVDSQPLGLAVDNGTDTLYVANEGSSDVSVLSAKNTSLLASIPIAGFAFAPDLQGVAYDSSHQIVWVTAGRTVVAIDPKVQRAVDEVNYDPSGVAFDPANGNVCVTNSANVTFGCFIFGSTALSPDQNVTFSETGLPSGAIWSVSLTGTLSGATTAQTSNRSSMVFGVDSHFGYYNYTFAVSKVSGYAPTPGTGYDRATYSSSVNITFLPNGLYFLTFSESGLPYGTGWSATVSGILSNSTSSSIRFTEPNGTYNFTIGPVPGWTASLTSGTVAINGTGANIPVVWTRVGLFLVIFSETGLPNGTTWGFAISGGPTFSTAASSISFTEPNGTYTYAIQRETYWITAQPTGSFTVAGASVSVSVPWVQIVTYDVTFVETGLLGNGTAWAVNLPASVTTAGNQTSTGSSVTFPEPNGSYAYQIPNLTAYGLTEYAPTPSSGSVVVQGAAIEVAVRFSLEPWFYPLTFQESGLPQGVSWSVALAGQGLHSSGASIVAPELNGTYYYTVGGGFGFSPTPSSGWVSVFGNPVTVSIIFGVAAGYYGVSFIETGLPPGAAWSVTLAGAVETSTGSEIQFAETNGSYDFAVGLLVGYNVTPRSGSVVVNGAAPPAISVRFSSTNVYAIIFQETGLPSGTGWAVSIGSQIESTLTNRLTLLEPNGTYGYLILPVFGYTAPSSGFVSVNGTNQSVNVTFSPQTYPVIVVEFGLPNGTRWNVTVVNSATGFNATYSTNGSALIFYLPNGTYSISVSAPGYSATVSSPTFTIAGTLLGGAPTVRFSSHSGTPGLFAGGITLTLLLVSVAAGLAATAATVILVKRKIRREGDQILKELTSNPAGTEDLVRR